MIGILSFATQAATLFGAFDKAAAVTAKVLTRKKPGAPQAPARMEPFKSGADSSTTLVASRALALGGVVGPLWEIIQRVWYAVGETLPQIHDAAATGAVSTTDFIMIGSGFLMAVMRYQTSRAVAT